MAEKGSYWSAVIVEALDVGVRDVHALHNVDSRERAAEVGVKARDWTCVQAMCFAISYVLQKGMC
jgi:hypothetical protein